MFKIYDSFRSGNFDNDDGLHMYGEILSPEETQVNFVNFIFFKNHHFKEHAEYVKHHATIQFINLFQKYKSRYGDPFKWGDEIEYVLVDQHDEKSRLLLKATEGVCLNKISFICDL